MTECNNDYNHDQAEDTTQDRNNDDDIYAPSWKQSKETKKVVEDSDNDTYYESRETIAVSSQETVEASYRNECPTTVKSIEFYHFWCIPSLLDIVTDQWHM